VNILIGIGLMFAVVMFFGWVLCALSGKAERDEELIRRQQDWQS